MKHLLYSACAAVVALSMVACGTKRSDVPVGKKLVLYYSQTGTTKAVADEIARATGADIEALELKNPYSGTYDETIKRVQEEQAGNILPSLEDLKCDIAQYDTIFLGYPIWFGTYAPPIAALIGNENFAGKTIVPFCTFGSGGLEASAKALSENLPEAKVADGYGVRTARKDAIANEVNRFLVENHHIAGTVEKYAPFSALVDVTADDVAIFDAACGDYMFPLGIPVQVGKRETSTSSDYVFKANSGADKDGEAVYSTIYVTMAHEENAKPVFTRVVR